MCSRSLICIAVLLTAIATISADASDAKTELTTTVAKPVLPIEPQRVLRQTSPDNARQTRVLFITKQGCQRCETELERLQKPGGDFEIMRAAGWKIGSTPDNHIQIIDQESIPEIVKLLKAREYPTVACIVDKEIVRSFKDGCTTPLDVWTFGWLLKGQSERPASSIPEAARVETTGNYRLRGNHWTVESDPNPSKAYVIAHLRGVHAYSVAAYGTIENWSYEELRSLHDDIHEREGGGVSASYGYAGAPAANRSLDAFSGSRKATGR